MSSRLSCLVLALLLLPACFQPGPAEAENHSRTSSSRSQASTHPGDFQLAVLLPDQTPPAGTRTRLLRLLANPDTVVLLLGLGTLLIFAECNLPGAIVPGATGLLLLLSGIFALTLLPVRPSALLLLAASTATLAISARLPLFGLPALLGATGLIYSFTTLIASAPSSTPAVRPIVAIALGAAVSISASLLGRVAYQARRNKIVPASDADRTHPDLWDADASSSDLAGTQGPTIPSQRLP